MSAPDDSSPFRLTWQDRLRCDVTAALADARGLGPHVALGALLACRRVHLAMMREPWATYVEDGSKRVESRWGKVRCAPHDAISTGDVVIWKRTGGDVYGVSVVEGAITTYLRDDAHGAAMLAAHCDAIRVPYDSARVAGKRLLTLINVGPFVAIPAIKCGKRDRAGWTILHDSDAGRTLL